MQDWMLLAGAISGLVVLTLILLSEFGIWPKRVIRRNTARYEVWKKSFYTCKWVLVNSGELPVNDRWSETCEINYAHVEALQDAYPKPHYKITITLDDGDGNETIIEAS